MSQEISLRGTSVSACRTRDAALKKYTAFCNINYDKFETIQKLPVEVFTNDSWWRKLALFLVEVCELKGETAKSYLGSVKEFHYEKTRENNFWKDFEKTYAKIRKSKYAILILFVIFQYHISSLYSRQISREKHLTLMRTNCSLRPWISSLWLISWASS